MKAKRKVTKPAASEPATHAHTGTPHYANFGKETDKPAPAAPARDAAEDPRYAGGDVFDLNNEQTGL